MTPAAIISRCQDRLALLRLGFALALWATAAGAAILLGATVDGLSALDDRGRWVALFVLAGGIGGGFLALAGLSHRLRPDTERAAQLAERGDGDRYRALTTAAELADMHEPLAQQAAVQFAAGLDGDRLLRALPRPPLRRVALIAVGIATAALLVQILVPGFWARTLARLAAPWLDLPPWSPTTLTLIDPPSLVPHGAPVVLTVAVDGPVPEDLMLMLASTQESDAQPESQTVPMLRGSKGQWQVTLAPLHAPLRVWASGNGTRSRYHAIDLDPQPILDQLAIIVHQPAYAELDTTTAVVEPAALVTLHPLPTAQFLLAPRANLALTRIELTPVAGGPAQVLELAAGTSDMTASTVWTSWQPGDWVIRVASASGVWSQPHPCLRLVAREDRPPEVRFVSPERNGFAVIDAVLPIMVTADDDLGLAAIRLEKAHEGCPAPPRTHAVSGRQAEHVEALDLRQLGVQVGETLTLSAVASDRKPPEGQWSTPARVVLRIIDRTTYNAQLRERLDADALMQLYAPLFQELAAQAQAGRDPAQREEALDALAELRRQVEAMRHDEELIPGEHQAQQRLLDQIAQAEKDLREGRDPGEPGAAEADALADQAALANGLALVELLREIARRERDLATELQRLAAVPDDPAVRAQARRHAEDQQQLREALTRWDTEVRQTVDQLRERQPDEASALAELADQVGTCGAGGHMDTAAIQAGAGRTTTAATAADDAATALENLFGACAACENGLRGAGGSCASNALGSDVLGDCLGMLESFGYTQRGGSLFGRGAGPAGAAGANTFAAHGGSDPQRGEAPALYGPEARTLQARPHAGQGGQNGAGTPQVETTGSEAHDGTGYRRAVRGSTTGETVFISPREEVVIDTYFRELAAPGGPDAP